MAMLPAPAPYGTWCSDDELRGVVAVAITIRFGSAVVQSILGFVTPPSHQHIAVSYPQTKTAEQHPTGVDCVEEQRNEWSFPQE
jgi:hypothetical protein